MILVKSNLKAVQINIPKTEDYYSLYIQVTTETKHSASNYATFKIK